MTKIASVTACNAIQTRLFELHTLWGSWRAVGLELDVSSGMAWRVANEGYEPVDPEIRKKLGFPQIIKQVVYRSPIGRFRKAGE